ncbi:MAG: hypothetical protein JWO19_6146 [Bryobacterales bacterium]|nr:hypothetical protein [Bryobacterales bacterium]
MPRRFSISHKSVQIRRQTHHVSAPTKLLVGCMETFWLLSLHSFFSSQPSRPLWLPGN